MELEKKDVAKALGLKYHGEEYLHESDYYVFLFQGRRITVPEWKGIEDAWEEAAEKVLEPLIEFISKSL